MLTGTIPTANTNLIQYPSGGMEATIEAANKTLKKFLSGKCHSNVMQSLIQKSVGICVLRTFEVAGVVSASVGHGLIFRKHATGKWSAPAACGMKALGAGFVLGFSKKEILVFIFNEEELEAMIRPRGLKGGFKCENTIGNLGGSKHWGGSTLAIGSNKGLFTGSSLECVMLKTNNKMNHAFYGQNISASEILHGEVGVPENDRVFPTLTEIYKQL